MINLFNYLLKSLCLYLFSISIIAIYSFVVYFLGIFISEDNVNAQLIFNKQGDIIGSKLLSQNIDSDFYFRSRPVKKFERSCDIAIYNEKLKKELNNRYKENENPHDISNLVPSASLLDPYITKIEAVRQAKIIAQSRNIDIEIIELLIDKFTIKSFYPFFSLDIVNTTKLNYELDQY